MGQSSLVVFVFSIKSKIIFLLEQFLIVRFNSRSSGVGSNRSTTTTDK